MKKLLIVVLAIMLGACASAGVQVKREQLQAFKAGETTYQQVVEALGPPTSVMTQFDGSRIAIYSHAHVQTRPESFIPIVGAFVGGADTTMNTATLVFNANGILQRYSSSESALGSGTGLEAGRPIARTDQPVQAPQK